ncbi:transcription factor TFIIIB component B'' homolog [Anopheles gambiae]|uniref:Transcription factor TFIIIB component B'' n=1 Tax=Anopheles gambiae TaxID=7165 RepID=A0A1S4GYX3_ANOGA|nr:transcription factor TFIIIB component B'' homolog [Anopheles gambiae]
MATRRPRVKVAANLSIRRPAKTTTTNVTGETIKQEAHVTLPEPVQEPAVELPSATVATPPEEDAPVPPEHLRDVKAIPVPSSVPEAPPEETFQEFKLPKPPDVPSPLPVPCLSGYDAQPSNSFIGGEEPMSPRKQDTRPTFTLPLARKRIRTESLTSNKSLPEGVTVNKVTRKLATKQEESQRTLDNKKEIRKRLTNIENVDKQNLTMFDMIYYNPVNNPMTPPALSKRGSLENIPKSVDGREGGNGRGSRSRSVSKSRSPTPAPSGSVPVVAAAPKSAAPPAPVTLTPQLKLGPNGEMILDEASLVVENEREREMRETLANTDIVYQDEFSGNSGYYSRIRRTKDWGDEETIRFYRCLHTIGTDFSMMLTLFPQRSRRDLKLKFKKEERINLNLVNKALLHPNEFNVDELRQQFAEEDEQLERQRQEEQQRKMEALEQQQKEKLRKNLMMRMSASNSPQRRISKAERVMTDGSEVPPGDETKKPKRKAPSKKRSTAKADDSGPNAPTTSAEHENEHQQLEHESNNTAIVVEGSSEINPATTEPKEEASKKRKRAPVPKKRAAAKQNVVATVTTAMVEHKEEQPSAYVAEENGSALAEHSDHVVPVDTAASNTPEADSFHEWKHSPVSKKETIVQLDDGTVVPIAMEENAQQQTKSVPERSVSPECTANTPMDTAQPAAGKLSLNAAPKKPPSPQMPNESAPPSPDNDAGEEDMQQDTMADGSSDDDDGDRLVIDERTNTPASSAAPADGKKHSQKKLKHLPKKKRFFGKPRPQLVASRKRTDKPPVAKQELLDLPDEEPVVIKKDPTEDVDHANNVPPGGPCNEPNASDQPYVLYEPAAVATYESSANLELPIVKYQCMEDLTEEEDGYRPSDDVMGAGDYRDELGRGVDGTGNVSAASASASSVAAGQPEQEEDVGITVITLQNLDDQTQTTCLRTDVAPSVQPTLINELTPVEIKYDEYEPEGQLVLGLDNDDSIVKNELLQHGAQSGLQRRNELRSNAAPVNVQVIDWPPVAGGTAIPYVVSYGKLDSYGCSSDTVIIPDEIIPPQAMMGQREQHVVQYAPLAQTIVNVAPPPVEQAAGPTAATTSLYAPDARVQPGQGNVQTALPPSVQCTAAITPKHEHANQPPNSALHTTEQDNSNGGGGDFATNTAIQLPALEIAGEAEQPCKRDPVDNDPAGAEAENEVEEEEEEEEEEGEGDGGFSLEDIDINSLVLVESQDSGDPNKTFYEIYVSNPDTGQLSEKPLDVPADVIESIRQILEGGGER